MNIKKGDIVSIISGNDKGKQGRVLEVLVEEGRLLVEGLNMKKKHVRGKRQGQKGEVVKMPAPIPVSRAMIVCGSCGKATRLGLRTEGGAKIRVCRKCGKAVS